MPLSIWAATFLHTFERKTARVKQLWGVEEREARETPNPDYDPNHTGAPWRQASEKESAK